MPIIREAQHRGATFVVIDPFRTRTAQAADWHISPKPGTDGALALGLAHVIFRDGLHDEAYLEANTVGWQAFRDRCAEFPPDRVAQYLALVGRLARLLKEEPVRAQLLAATTADEFLTPLRSAG